MDHDGIEGPLVVDDAINKQRVRVCLATQRVEVRGRTRIERARAREVFAGLPRGNARDKVNKRCKIAPVQG